MKAVFVYWQTEWLSLLVDALTLAILIGASFVAWAPVKHAYKEHRYQVLKDLSFMWESEPLIETRWRVNQLADKLTDELTLTDTQNLRDFYILVRVATFFEDVGSLAAAGLLNRDDATREFGHRAQHYFRLYEPYIRQERNRDPLFLIHFEELATRESKS